MDLVNVDLLIKDGLIVTVDAQRRVISSGAVAIAEGRIVDVGKTDEIARRYSADEVLDATDFIVLPGLIDSHVHISAEHLTRGIVTDDAGPEWLGKWGLPLYAALTPEDEYLGAKLSCLEMIRNGTTTFGEGGTVRDMAATVQAIDEARLRAVLAPWISDASGGSLLLRRLDQTLSNWTVCACGKAVSRSPLEDCTVGLSMCSATDSSCPHNSEVGVCHSIYGGLSGR